MKQRRDETYERLSTDEKTLVNTEQICQTVDMMRKDYSKIIYALLGIVAATLGLKFAGTPWYIDATIYLSLFAGVFVLGVSFALRREFSFPQRLLRYVFSVFLIFNGIVQTAIYHPGSEIAPVWFNPVVEAFLIIIAACLIWATWTVKPKWNGRERRKVQANAMHCNLWNGKERRKKQ